ncbi:hypothetical protein ACOMHN_045582 [Nucella lapillus]
MATSNVKGRPPFPVGSSYRAASLVQQTDSFCWAVLGRKMYGSLSLAILYVQGWFVLQNIAYCLRALLSDGVQQTLTKIWLQG